MAKSKEQRLDDSTNAWLDRLATRGLDTTPAMPALGSLFSFITSGFGARDGKRIAPGASDNHEAHDMTVVTKAHYNNTKKYPLLRGSIEGILGKFPGLRAQFEAQMDEYETPDDIKNIPVKSMVAGEVLYAGEWNRKSGESVMIGGDDGRIYSYAHLAKGSYKVQEGQRVKRGQEIALMDKPTGNTDGGKCVHVVNRLLPFAGRDGEKPDFKRWSYLHKDDNGFVPASVFAEALKELRAEHGGKLSYKDLDKKPTTFLYNDNPKVGESQRPELAEDKHAKPVGKHAETEKKAEPKKQKGFFGRLKDKACDWFGIGCEAEPEKKSEAPPIKPAKPATKPVAKAAVKPATKAAAKDDGFDLGDIGSSIGRGFSSITSGVGALIDVDWFDSPPARNATKPVASVKLNPPTKHR